MQGPGPKMSHSWSDSKDSASFRVVHCPVCGQRDTPHLLISVCARPTPHAVMEDLSLGEAKGPAQEPSAGGATGPRRTTRHESTHCTPDAGRALTACRMRAEHGPSTHCVPDAGQARPRAAFSLPNVSVRLDDFVHFTDEDTDVQRLNRPCEISTTIIPHLSEEETKAQRDQVHMPKITQPFTGGAPEAHAGGLMPEATKVKFYFLFLKYSKSQVANFQRCKCAFACPTMKVSSHIWSTLSCVCTLYKWWYFYAFYRTVL